MELKLLLFRPVKDFSVSFSKAVVSVGAVPILRLVQQYNGSVSRRFSPPEYIINNMKDMLS